MFHFYNDPLKFVLILGYKGTEVPTDKVTYLKLHNTKTKAWTWIHVAFYTRLTFFPPKKVASLSFQENPNKGTSTKGQRKMRLDLKHLNANFICQGMVSGRFRFSPFFLLWCSESQLYISNKKDTCITDSQFEQKNKIEREIVRNGYTGRRDKILMWTFSETRFQLIKCYVNPMHIPHNACCCCC